MTTATAWKAVRPDLTTRYGVRWYPGTTVRADHNLDPDNTGACPTREGDGLCLAKSWRGASSAGFTTTACVVVEYDTGNVIAEDHDKLRVAGDVTVIDLYDAQALLRDGFGADANLSGADLSVADLSGADLSVADLSRANLSVADLSRANLSGADLSVADLSRANLSRADLSVADLSRANLSRANLSGANLSGADLSGADLSGADLSVADLSRANLSRANLGEWERGPDGYARRKGAV